ncbi:hypothetical protein [Chondromyces apiculatus]|uniref:Uncharacterized protein n=1 Tax=Chondromyces apiculatus DSM 436 TaxID=1192034 RepID=A0A017SV33_9BACT|nr:hypothetical protein [Chondromyces apiculatus]EYF00602.1 Hypothetical protein CAP_0417 [Chondromyces apiculatus DSM 436]
MTLERLRVLGEQVAAFLRDALGGRVPARDRPRAEAIRATLSEILAGGMDDVTGDGWREALLAPSVDAVLDMPERWQVAVDLVAIYFHKIEKMEDAELQERGAAGADSANRPIEEMPRSRKLGLAAFLLRQLLLRGTDQRRFFLGQISSWNVLHVIPEVLPGLALDEYDVLALVRSLDAVPPNDLARSKPFSAASTWISHHPSVGRRIVDAWFAQESWTEGLTSRAACELVIGVVRAGDSHLPWRDEVVARLIGEPDERLWGDAVWLACFAWPAPEPPARVRHKALIDAVMRFPPLLVEQGLAAMVREAQVHPVESVSTAASLLRLLAERHDREDIERRCAPLLALVAWYATGSVRKGPSETEALDLQALVPVLMLVEPAGAPRGLDYWLAEQVVVSAGVAKDFTAAWLALHSREIFRQHLSFGDMLPVLEHDLGAEGITRWLLSFLVHPRADTRLVAAYLLGKLGGVVVPEGFLAALSAEQVDALAHEIIGGVTNPDTVVRWLVHIAQQRPDRLDLVQNLLLEDVAEDYPAACRRGMALLPTSGPDALAALIALRARVLTQLDEADAVHERARQVGDVIALRPARRAWHEVQNRLFQESARDARSSGRYVFASVVTMVPIARGEATAPQLPGDEPVRFETFSSGIELPLRELIDPLIFRASRVRHRQAAATLLAREAHE